MRSAASLTVISGNNARRLIEVQPQNGGNPHLVLSGITVADGFADFAQGAAIDVRGGSVSIANCNIQNNRAALQGAAIYVQNGSVEIAQSSLIANYGLNLTTGGGQTAFGGGLYLGTGASAYIDSSSIVWNQDINGGGIAAQSNAYLKLTNSTIGMNSASAKGGGLFLSDSVTFDGEFNTIVGNVAGAQSEIGESAYGGGLALSGYTGSFTMVGTILAGNSTFRPQFVTLPTTDPVFDGDDCIEDYVLPSSYTPSVRNNLVGELDNCSFASTSWPLIGQRNARIDPKLDTLNYNSQPPGVNKYNLPSFMPLAGSPVLQAYTPFGAAGGRNTTACPTYDQRGFFRASTDICDIGAIDYSTHQ